MVITKKSSGIETAVRIGISGLVVDASADETPVVLRAPYVSPADHNKESLDDFP